MVSESQEGLNLLAETNSNDDVEILTKMASMEICYDPVYYKKD